MQRLISPVLNKDTIVAELIVIVNTIANTCPRYVHECWATLNGNKFDILGNAKRVIVDAYKNICLLSAQNKSSM